MLYLSLANIEEFKRERRKAKGGHWEKWIVDGYSDMWFQVDECYKVHDNRPSPLCRCHPICEDYPNVTTK